MRSSLVGGAGLARLGVASLPELFRGSAARYADAPALADATRALTYAELDEVSDRVAAALVARGVAPGDFVGVVAERTLEMAVAILGVLKAGATYVPVDPTSPTARVAGVLADTGLSVVVGDPAETEGTALEQLEHVGPCTLGGAVVSAAVDVEPGDGAYVIYTSGSTGTPNGCMVTHRNVLALLEGALPMFDLHDGEVWTLLHSCSFDFSVWEMWAGWASGALVLVVPAEIAQAPAALVGFLRHHRVSVLNIVPSVFAYLAAAYEDAGRPPLALRYVVFGGESVDLAATRRFLGADTSRPAIVNMYGITETTVHVTFKLLEPDALEGPVRSPIGKPLPHLQISLLDEARRPVAPGQTGEIYVSGESVSAGYLNRPDLTAERFVDLETDAGTIRAYRSGDLARQLPGGEYEFLGRNDHQIKLRGYRIELEEIESVVSSDDAVRHAAVAVAADGTGTARLVAFVVPEDGSDDDLLPRVRRRAADQLPHYMLPATFEIVESLPLTQSGKLDRQAVRALASPHA